MRSNFLIFVISKKIRVFLKKLLSYSIFFLVILLIYFRVFFSSDYFALKQNVVSKFYKFIYFDQHQIQQVLIFGDKHIPKDHLKKTIDLILKSNKNISNDSILKQIKQRITQNPWVEGVRIIRNINSNNAATLKIFITEYQPFAIFLKNSKNFLINKEGEIITGR